MLPDYFNLENKRSELIEKILSTSSSTLKVFLFYNYFSKILECRDPKIHEAFLNEFIDEYLSVLSGFQVWGINPHFTENLLYQLKQLKDLKLPAYGIPETDTIITRINLQRSKQLNILYGKSEPDTTDQKAYFPLIDRESKDGFYGIIDSVTIRLNRSSGENKFIIIPSEREIDKRIIEQCRISWDLAVEILKRYVRRPFKYHEVIISFEKKEGYYEGDSLGAALTISFLEQLMKFYNPVFTLTIAKDVAFTGALTAKGESVSTGDKIIKQKVDAVFFSGIKTFVFPRSVETAAIEEYNLMKKQYPARSLKLVQVDDINDILNRRDIVEIKKMNPALRSAKFLGKNWLSAVIIILSLCFIIFVTVLDVDDNPSTLSADGTSLFVKNKNGKVLWTKSISFNPLIPVSEKAISRLAKLVDINGDGNNELIITSETDKESGNLDNRSIIRCYDKDQNILWRYTFRDSVSSKREELNTEYGITLLDTLTYSGQKSLFLISSNGPSFSSAIYRIDLARGKRLPGTFWSAGHVMDAYIKDVDLDKKHEIIGAGYDNSYEDLVFFAYEIDTLTKMRPETDEYMLKGFPTAEMIVYIRFPKTDYDNYFKVRTPVYFSGGFSFEDVSLKFKFGPALPEEPMYPELGYEINYNFKDIEVVVSSPFRVQRDSLVVHGLLKTPYTDTKDYKNLIRNGILYWKDGKWVKRDDIL